MTTLKEQGISTETKTINGTEMDIAMVMGTPSMKDYEVLQENGYSTNGVYVVDDNDDLILYFLPLSEDTNENMDAFQDSFY